MSWQSRLQTSLVKVRVRVRVVMTPSSYSDKCFRSGWDNSRLRNVGCHKRQASTFLCGANRCQPQRPPLQPFPASWCTPIHRGSRHGDAYLYTHHADAFGKCASSRLCGTYGAVRSAIWSQAVWTRWQSAVYFKTGL